MIMNGHFAVFLISVLAQRFVEAEFHQLHLHHHQHLASHKNQNNRGLNVNQTDLDFDDEGHTCGAARPTHAQELQLDAAVKQWHHRRRRRNRMLQNGHAALPESPVSLINSTITGSVESVDSTIHTIPVQFTILEAEDGRGSNLTDELVQSRLMTSLNDNFAESNAPFVFELLGIQRAQNESWFKCRDKELYKSLYKVGDEDTMNVFVCNTFADGNFGIYGSSNLPDFEEAQFDGIDLMNPSLSKETVSYLLMENNFVHEVGHWLGLFHTFHNACDPPGDYVTDTPAHASPTSRSGSGGDSCFQNLTSPLDTCPNNSGLIDAGPDPVDNFMNYVYFRNGDWGKCYDEHGRFTPLQVERMVALYESYRLKTRTVNLRDETGKIFDSTRDDNFVESIIDAGSDESGATPSIETSYPTTTSPTTSLPTTTPTTSLPTTTPTTASPTTAPPTASPTDVPTTVPPTISPITVLPTTTPPTDTPTTSPTAKSTSVPTISPTFVPITDSPASIDKRIVNSTNELLTDNDSGSINIYSSVMKKFVLFSFATTAFIHFFV